MNVGQALVLILCFPVLGLLMAVLTALEKWAVSGPGPSGDGRASAENSARREPASPGAAATPGKDGGRARQLSPGDAQGELPLVARRGPWPHEGRLARSRTRHSVPARAGAAARPRPRP